MVVGYFNSAIGSTAIHAIKAYIFRRIEIFYSETIMIGFHIELMDGSMTWILL